MATFIYRCPATGLNVQGLWADDLSLEDENIYESVTCTACTKFHLINPKTGKILGANEE
jgi:hypothetical protein